MNITHVATRSRRKGVGLFRYQATLADPEQLERLRRDLTLQITKEQLERPHVVLIGIDGGKKK